MEAQVAAALEIDRDSGARERTVDITTVGRRSGKARRIETWFYRVDGTVYLSGLPGKRGWAANLEAEPAFTFHLKNEIQADLPARATRIDDEAERRRIMGAIIDYGVQADLVAQADRIDDEAERRRIIDGLNSLGDLEARVAGSPLFAVEFDQ